MTTKIDVIKPEPLAEGVPMPEWLKLVDQQVRSLKFGVVQVVVHESKVVQIETTQKVRLDRHQSPLRPTA